MRLGDKGGKSVGEVEREEGIRVGEIFGNPTVSVAWEIQLSPQ